MVNGDSDFVSRLITEATSLRDEGKLVEFDYPYSYRARPWQRSPALARLARILAEARPRAHEHLLEFARHMRHFLAIPVASGPEHSELDPYWLNGFFPGLDGVTLYGLLVQQNPRFYVEVGSGNSTKFARRAIGDHGLRTKILSIDPEPRAVIDELCDQVERVPFEQLDPERFQEFQADDLLFVDCSHRSFQGSDVTVLFTEVIPVLPRGMIYGIHDIWLPHDYPEHWRRRLYNEQYLLAAYLFGGADGDEILLPNAYVSHSCPDLLSVLDELWTSPAHAGIEAGGGCFWMRRVGPDDAVRPPSDGGASAPSPP
jgi:hypothetical protein